jgi:hypothetical protein
MQNLNDLKSSVLKLSDADYAEFRKWFWEHENERWDIKDLANKAIADFNQGNLNKYEALYIHLLSRDAIINFPFNMKELAEKNY